MLFVLLPGVRSPVLAAGGPGQDGSEAVEEVVEAVGHDHVVVDGHCPDRQDR